MKRLLLILVMLSFALSAITAQDMFDPRLLTKIGLTQQQIEELQEIQFQAELKIREANVEMNILKAQLEKLLLNEDPDMQQVRSTIEATLRWRVQSEIANVEARVQIRERLGSDNWGKLLRLRKQIQQRAQENSTSQNQAEPNGRANPNNNPGNSNSRN